MKISEIHPAIGRLIICQEDLKLEKEQNKRMSEALKEIKRISKRLNLWVGIESIIDPILKDLE